MQQLMHDSWNTFLQVLTTPLVASLDPSRRIYWLFLVVSILLALTVFVMQKKQFLPVVWMRQLFSRHYLFSSSSGVDFFYWFVNSLIKLLLVIPLAGGHLACTLLVVRFLYGHFGIIDTPMTLAMPVLVVLYTCVFLVVEDASRYGLHRLMHRVPFLWRFHKIHHSATVLTPFTLYRVHPVEMTLYYLRGTLVFGVVSGCFIYMWGSNVKGWQILGVDAIGFLFNLAAANLRHSHIWLSFGVFERWFISPAQHQIHHSTNPIHFNQNYGSILALWDRLFGSWRASGKFEVLKFGLGRG
ncbi:sterol desaturase family protein [Marinagarivorans algicola]|uniref:sterol desaturase family protein n=1 Tax=Marinagarivorans algicola TaxID=1513270 RepID=UPI0006B68B47|nr:sterol desaturase family protein [Marinagarivorans algicola]